MKKIKIIIFLIIALTIMILGFGTYKLTAPTNTTSIQDTVLADPHDGTYTIAGEKITLVNGISEMQAAPGSTSKITTRYFGNDVSADLDGDGTLDNAFLITQETGGSGTFYYVVALLQTTDGPIGTNSLLLGDRIAPQTTEQSTDGMIVVNYADRTIEEDFTVAPSVGKSLYFKVNPQTIMLEEITQNPLQ